MKTPFYQKNNGLQFECTRCGNCCTRPGPVFFTPAELARAADFLRISPSTFRRRYGAYREEGVWAIDPQHGPCFFYDEDTGCTIYEARPLQCRTWPFWPETVLTRRAWNAAARDCEGMNQGPRVPPEEIERLLVECERAGLPEGEPWS